MPEGTKAPLGGTIIFLYQAIWALVLLFLPYLLINWKKDPKPVLMDEYYFNSLILLVFDPSHKIWFMATISLSSFYAHFTFTVLPTPTLSVSITNPRLSNYIRRDRQSHRKRYSRVVSIFLVTKERFLDMPCPLHPFLFLHLSRPHNGRTPKRRINRRSSFWYRDHPK